MLRIVPFGAASVLAALVAALSAHSAYAQANGLYGEYYDTVDFTGGVVGTATDLTVDFNWGDGTVPPQPPGLTGADTFTVRWSGLIEAAGTGTYTFTTRSDDGVRLWVDGRLLIDRWRDLGQFAQTGTIDLVAGQRYSIRLEYFENVGLSEIHLDWTPPGLGQVVVPSTQLFTQVAPPRISPAGGAFTNSQAVSISCDTFGAAITYTVNGGAPTAYTGPFAVAADATIAAVATKAGLTASMPAIAVFTVTDATPPALSRVYGPTATEVVVVFTEPVAASAATPAYYTVNAVAATGAGLRSDLRTVVLTVAAMTSGASNTLSVSNVTDRVTPTPNTIPAGSQRVFTYIAPASVGLTGYWRFDEPAGDAILDSSASANNGNRREAATIGAGPLRIEGPFVGALEFDGVNDNVAVAADLNTVLGGAATGFASLSAWVRLPLGSQGHDVNYRAPGITGVESFGDGNDSFWGWVSEAGLMGVRSEDIGGAQTPNPVNDGLWHHVAFTHDYSVSPAANPDQVFLDGVLVSSGTSGTSVKTVPFFEIGRITDSQGVGGNNRVYFLGSLDEVRVYNTILNAAQIQTLANQPPVVTAGADQSVAFGTTVSLSGSYTDDALPVGGVVTTTWSQVSGPGLATFNPGGATSTSLTPTVTFTTGGTYVLRLTVSDGEQTSSDDLIVVLSQIVVSPVSGLVTTEGGGTANFTITLSQPPTALVTINLSSSNTSEGTVPASVTFATGVVVRTVTVTGVNDLVADGPIPYTVVTAAAVTADGNFSGVNPSDVTVTNNDNDTPSITVTPVLGLTTTEAGGQATFTVVLNTIPTAPVMIGISSSNTGEGSVAPALLTFPATAAALTPQTVTITGVDDFIQDFSISYIVITAAATSVDPNYNGRSAMDVSVTNLDDEPTPELEKQWGNCLSSTAAGVPGGGSALLAAILLAASLAWRRDRRRMMR